MMQDTDATRAYRILRDLIVQAELRPGAAIEEDVLLARLSVGRTPFRDALHRLAHEGLVEILPRRGSFVTQVTVTDLQQIFEVRLVVEEIVARLAVERCAPHHLHALLVLIESYEDSDPLSESDGELDTEFHDLLLEISNNKYLDDIYHRLRLTALRLLYITGCGMESKADQKEFFEGTHEALSTQDTARMTHLLQDHAIQFQKRLADAIFTSQPLELTPEA